MQADPHPIFTPPAASSRKKAYIFLEIAGQLAVISASVATSSGGMARHPLRHHIRFRVITEQ
jgi:hypothetical protein